MTIQSDSTTASSYAQGIMDSVNSVTSGTTVTKDASSISQGNSLGSGYVDTEVGYASSISSQVKAFISNVHSVAAEFEAVDNKISNDISGKSTSLPATPGTSGKSASLPNTSAVPPTSKSGPAKPSTSSSAIPNQFTSQPIGSPNSGLSVPKAGK